MPKHPEHPSDPSRPLPPNVWILGGASCLNDMASEMIYPLLPRFLLESLGGNKFQLGLIEGVAETVASLMKLGAGGLSDRWGARKGFVVGGYALAALIRPLLAVIVAPWQLLTLRFTDRLGKGIRTAPRDALIADSVPSEQRGRAFAVQRGLDHLGAALGPLIAAALLWFWPDQLRLLFLLSLTPGLVLVGMLVVGLRELPLRTPDSSGDQFAWTLKPLGRDFRLLLISLAIFTLGNSSDAFLLVRAGELGVPQVGLPLLWFAFHVVKSGGSLLIGSSIDRLGPKPLILAGWMLYAVVYLGFALAWASWHIWALFAVYGLYYVLSEPAEKTLVANLAPVDRRGLAFGWFNFAIGIAALPASLLFGLLYERSGALTAFGFGATSALVASLLLIGVRSKPQ